MCGISGIYGYGDSSALRRMCQTMNHRGPDDEGYFTDEKMALGMNRLSIIDLQTGHQPIPNEDETIWLIVNGEIYNYLDLRASLEKKGHRFRTKTDSETILHLYEEYGEEFLQHLRGMFALAIWDKPNDRLFLARDRLGIKPLYYHFKKGKLAFASEIKALLSSGLCEKRVSKQALNYFLSYASIPPPLTIFEEVKSLLPGYYLKLEKGTLTLSSYWDVNYTPGPPKEEGYYAEGLTDLLRESIKLRLMSDVPLGVFLSGGIDSSGLLALMRQAHSGKIKTFSIGFSEGGERYNETSHAAKVARHFDTEHREATISSTDMLQELPRIIRAMDQPTGDGINSYFVSRFAREGVTVALSGTGGDELFAGYEWFNRIRKWNTLINFIGKVPSPLNRTICRLMSELGYNLPDINFHNTTASSFGNIYGKVRSLFHQEELNVLLSSSFMKEYAGEKTHSYLHEDPAGFFLKRADRFSDVLHQTCYMQLKMDMPNLLLRDIDAMSMAHSLEVRVPFLDHKFVEFAATIPSSLIMRNGKGKYILLQALRKLLPEEILGRKKMGFIFPIDYWLKGPLKSVVEKFLSRESVQKRGILNFDEVLKIKNHFYSGKLPFFKLWNLVVLELWHRYYIDNDSFSSIPDSLEDLAGV